MRAIIRKRSEGDDTSMTSALERERYSRSRDDLSKKVARIYSQGEGGINSPRKGADVMKIQP